MGKFLSLSKFENEEYNNDVVINSSVDLLDNYIFSVMGKWKCATKLGIISS